MNPDTSKLIDAIDLVIESVLLPDEHLRQEAKDTGCYTEMLEVREDLLYALRELRQEALDVN